MLSPILICISNLIHEKVIYLGSKFACFFEKANMCDNLIGDQTHSSYIKECIFFVVKFIECSAFTYRCDLNFKPNALLSGQQEEKHGRMATYFASVPNI